MTTPQIIGGILIVVIVVAAAVWYVPRIVRADGRSFTGTVSSSGVTNLNFANSGLVGKVPVQLGQAVKAGQVLATETSPSTTAAISADRAAIAADKAGLAESKVSGTRPASRRPGPSWPRTRPSSPRTRSSWPRPRSSPPRPGP